MLWGRNKRGSTYSFYWREREREREKTCWLLTLLSARNTRLEVDLSQLTSRPPLSQHHSDPHRGVVSPRLNSSDLTMNGFIFVSPPPPPPPLTTHPHHPPVSIAPPHWREQGAGRDKIIGFLQLTFSIISQGNPAPASFTQQHQQSTQSAPANSQVESELLIGNWNVENFYQIYFNIL